VGETDRCKVGDLSCFFRVGRILGVGKVTREVGVLLNVRLNGIHRNKAKEKKRGNLKGFRFLQGGKKGVTFTPSNPKRSKTLTGQEGFLYELFCLTD